MTDLFVSYASEDREHVALLVGEFERQGWTVWWDRHIETGHSFDKNIEEAIDASLCVVVVWSRASIDSDWVRAEAAEGLERNILVPILLDEVKPPLLFRQKQAVNLVDWKKSGGGRALDALMPSISAILDSYRKSTIPISTQRAWVLGKIQHGPEGHELAAALHFAMSLALSYLDNLFLYDASFNETRVNELEPEQLQALVSDEGLDGYLYGELGESGGPDVTLTVHIRSVSEPPSSEELRFSSGTDAFAEQLAGFVIGISERLQGRRVENEAALVEYLSGIRVDVLASYARSLELAQQNDYVAVKHTCLRCIDTDPEFWPAYRGLAVACIYLGQEEEARSAMARSVKSIKRESPKNQHFARGVYHAIYNQDYDKSGDEFEAMLRLSPLDVSAINNLAVSRYYQLRFGDARELGNRDLQLYPGKLLGRQNVAFYAMYANEPEEAFALADSVLKENTAFHSSVVLRGLCRAGLGDVDGAAGIYEEYLGESPAHRAICLQGLADLALAEGRPDDARALLEEGISLDRAAEHHEHQARKLLMLAETESEQDPATRILESLEVSTSTANLLALAALCAETSTSPPELALRESRKRTGSHGRSCARILDGLAAAAEGDVGSTTSAFEAAQEEIDLWLVRYCRAHVLARADMLLEVADEAEACTDRYGEGLSATMDEQPSYRYLARIRALAS